MSPHPPPQPQNAPGTDAKIPIRRVVTDAQGGQKLRRHPQSVWGKPSALFLPGRHKGNDMTDEPPAGPGGGGLSYSLPESHLLRRVGTSPISDRDRKSQDNEAEPQLWKLGAPHKNTSQNVCKCCKRQSPRAGWAVISPPLGGSRRGVFCVKRSDHCAQRCGFAHCRVRK